MAPIKASKPIVALKTNTTSLTSKSILTRSQQQNAILMKNSLKDSRVKRKAETSPLKEVNKENKTTKRAAFGDLTNEITKCRLDGKKNVTNANGAKKLTVQSKILPGTKNVPAVAKNKNENVPSNIQKVKILTKNVTRVQTAKPDSTRVLTKIEEIKAAEKSEDARAAKKSEEPKVSSRRSDPADRSGDSLYVSAIEEISDTSGASCGEKSTKNEKRVDEIERKDVVTSTTPLKSRLRKVPQGVVDFDRENWDDVFQASHYAMDIFEYLKSREADFKIRDYMGDQKHINGWMRSLLIDWMVEIQESFELNHETLYLAVKLVDIYLNRVIVKKETLQLVGAAGLFVASKFDERIPPAINDFLFICDGAYTQNQLIKMEINLLKICNFQLGIPLSYRFLRRYARCAKVTMPNLTLARFILESSLLEYGTVTRSDSKLASAALYLALRMKGLDGWTRTLEYYSGYKLDEFTDEVHLLNSYLHKKPKEGLSTIRNKYSHKLFFEVAKTPLITI